MQLRRPYISGICTMRGWSPNGFPLRIFQIADRSGSPDINPVNQRMHVIIVVTFTYQPRIRYGGKQEDKKRRIILVINSFTYLHLSQVAARHHQKKEE